MELAFALVAELETDVMELDGELETVLTFELDGEVEAVLEPEVLALDDLVLDWLVSELD